MWQKTEPFALPAELQAPTYYFEHPVARGKPQSFIIILPSGHFVKSNPAKILFLFLSSAAKSLSPECSEFESRRGCQKHRCKPFPDGLQRCFLFPSSDRLTAMLRLYQDILPDKAPARTSLSRPPPRRIGSAILPLRYP